MLIGSELPGHGIQIFDMKKVSSAIDEDHTTHVANEPHSFSLLILPIQSHSTTVMTWLVISPAFHKARLTTLWSTRKRITALLSVPGLVTQLAEEVSYFSISLILLIRQAWVVIPKMLMSMM